MSKQVAQEVFDIVKPDFIWTADKEQFDLLEDWRSHANSITSGTPWRDDCDGFAATAMQLAHDRGARAGLIFCRTETAEGHLVCGVFEDDRTWIIDNRMRRLKEINEIPYEWISMTEDGRWRAIRGVSDE